ncbi:MAG: hypothetical protein RLZZ450_1596, partial [Pseudomonadota bacterium]
MSPNNRCGRTLRGRHSGAALVEGLVVSVLITIFLGGTWFFHELNARKGETLRLARYQAWAATRPECSGSTVHGRGTQTAQVPVTMRMGGMQPASLPVTSATDMAC